MNRKLLNIHMRMNEGKLGDYIRRRPRAWHHGAAEARRLGSGLAQLLAALAHRNDGDGDENA